MDQTGSKSSNLLDLKNPFFRWVGVLSPGAHPDLDGTVKWLRWGALSASLMLSVCMYVFAGTQAPPQTPLPAHTTPPHPRTCGTRVRPTAWVRGWLYQVNTHINTSSVCLQGAHSFTLLYYHGGDREWQKELTHYKVRQLTLHRYSVMYLLESVSYTHWITYTLKLWTTALISQKGRFLF